MFAFGRSTWDAHNTPAAGKQLNYQKLSLIRRDFIGRHIKIA
jgi:hypothetical protein